MADAGSFNADLGVNLQFNVDGAGLVEMSRTIKEISKGKDLQRYWKDVETATDNAGKAIERYSRNVNSQGLAESFLKQINALKAITQKENLSELFPNMDINFDELIESAKKVAPRISSEFSVSNFEQAFKTFDLLRDKGIELGEVFSQLADYVNVVKRNSELGRENSEFRNLLGDADIEKLKKDLGELQKLRSQAEREFESFLNINKIERKDFWGDEKFSEYFTEIRNGSMTATDAIARFKTEYGYLLEESFKTNGDTFGIEQLQSFANKLDIIFHQVEETSNKINDIISNGVIAKSVENLSVDGTLSDSQRSMFGDLLQDEESLKEITSLFKRLIEESNAVKNTTLFDEEQFNRLLILFGKIESSLSSMKAVFVDVGDGEEFSPLLKMINNVQSSISELSTSVKGIGLNMNIDVGSDSEMEAKVQSKIANALQAYQRLFDAIKMSGAGGSVINTNFFEFDINQYDTMMSKIQAYKKFIDNMRNEAKAQYNGKDILYQSVDKTYWTQASAAMGQVTKAFNEMNATSDTNPLKDLFGSGDLSEVVYQLGLIVAKLEEISTTASSFKEVFANGFNLTASVEEIDKLTNRVKELEDELSKIKLNPVSVDKSNISSENSIVESQNKIQEELKETQKQAEETSKAILKVTAYRGTNGGDPVTSNKSGATFWDSKKNVANMYGTNSNDKTLWSSELSFNNPLVIDAKKQKYGDISYLGDGADKASEAILELTKRENQLRESLEKSTKSGLEEVAMVYELQDVCRQIKKISDDTSNPYGTHSSDWFAEYAKNNGYDGLHIKNVLDTPDSYAKNGTEVSDVFVTFQREQLENTVLLAKANKDLVESEREVALAELGVVKNAKTPIEDVFQGSTTSAEKLEEEIRNIDSATEKASESAKEYRKILSQVGEFDIDSKVSAMYKRNDGQLESWTWRAKTDDDGNVLYDQNGRIDYDEPTVTVISKYEQLEKIIVKADNELRNLQKDLAEIKAYDSTASTTNIEAKISDQKEYIRLLEQTIKAISQSDEYLLDEQQIIDARNKAAREYALTMGSKQEKTDAKQSASDEKKRLANIEQVNRALNKQQITIEAIEKTYNKSTNPDLDREVSNQQDLAELAQKKFDIQTKINSLQGQERTSANEQEFLELEKLIAEYKELAKYKLKANNPSKQELGGQNLQTLIQVQISNYDKLITKAEKYGDATTDTVEKLKEQRDILSKIGADGKYTATADQYYSSRDTYKVESAALSAFEAETKAIEQKTQAVKRLKDELEGYNNQIPKKPIDGQRSDYFEGFVQKYREAIDEARRYLDTLGDSPITEEVKKEWERLIGVIKIAKEEMDAVPNAARGSDADARMKEIDKLTKYLDKNTRISKEAKEQLEGYLALLKSGDPSVNVKELHTAWTKVAVAEREAGREGKSFLDIFKNKVVYNYAAQLAGYYLSFMDMIRYARNAVSAVQELDTALVDLKKTTTMSASELERFYYDSNDVAKQMGTTTAEIINQASAWSRLGYSTKEASTQMAELSAQFAAISPDLDLDSATDGLVSSMKAFDIEVTNVERDIMDNINRIGNTAATSNGEIVDMLTRSSAAMAAANNTIQETIALETAAVEITRNAETTGTAFKTLSMRIRGYDEETEELSDDLKNISGDIADLTKTASTPGGISLFTDETKQTYKSTYQILKEISDIYDELSDKNRAELLEKLAGKRGGQVVAGLLSNFDAAEKALREMENAAGSADAEMSIVEESIDYKLNKLEQTWVGTAQAIIDRGDFGKAIDALTKLSEAIGWVIDKFGVLGTTSVIGGGILGAKNVGINTLVAY